MKPPVILFDDLQLKSFNPRVCMDPAVHYTTQSSAYDRLILNVPKEVSTKRYQSQQKTQSGSSRSERRLGKQVAFNLLKDLGI